MDKQKPKIMHGYGGENRLWIGPEGGRYSVFFKPGVEQVYDNWFAPAPFDNEPWRLVSSDKHSVRMEKDMPHPIPYVQQHIEAMGRKAADLLIEQMTSQSKMPQTCKFPATLMITPDSNS